MNVQIVSVTVFRKNTKDVLDDALKNTLFIRRGDELFELRYYGMIGRASGYVGETNDINGMEVTPTFGTFVNDHPKVPGGPTVELFPDDPTYTDVEEAA